MFEVNNKNIRVTRIQQITYYHVDTSDLEGKSIDWFLYDRIIRDKQISVLNEFKAKKGTSSTLIFFFPMFPFDPPEKIRKHLVL